VFFEERTDIRSEPLTRLVHVCLDPAFSYAA
jgi:hypothetical protein